MTPDKLARFKRRMMLGDAIRKQRSEKNLSQEKLAIMAGTSKAHIWRIEKGYIGVSIDKLIEIADALGVPTRELIKF